MFIAAIVVLSLIRVKVILTLRAVTVLSHPEAEYQIFQGFDLFSWTLDGEGDNSTSEESDAATTSMTPVNVLYNWTEVLKKGEATSPVTPISGNNTTNGPSKLADTTVSGSEMNWTISIKPHRKVTCPDEQPSSIGSYEVPTQQDLVLLTAKTLHRLFASYHQKTLQFLEDIRKATRDTQVVEKKCSGSKPKYRACVKYVSRKCETITKSITSTLEQQRRDVIAFGQETICSLNDMKQDPVKLIKTLASEEASLEFALPGFLRLLNSCSSFCTSPARVPVKPPRHLSDTDLVVRHFLAKKSYSRLIPDQTTPRIFKNVAALKKKM